MNVPTRCKNCNCLATQVFREGKSYFMCSNCHQMWLVPNSGELSDIPVVEEEEEPLWKQLAREHEEKKPKPQPRAADIFAPTYPRTIESVFKTLVPKEKTMTFSLLQAVYCDNPDRFRVISGIHQNSFEDKLHLSLAVDCGKSSYTLHVYGYWKNYFRVGAVTMKDDDEEIRTIATF
jgi:hypothetical protein